MPRFFLISGASVWGKTLGVRGPEPLSLIIRFGDMCGETKVVHAKHGHSSLMKCRNSKEFLQKENLSIFAAREPKGREAKVANSKQWPEATVSTFSS